MNLIRFALRKPISILVLVAGLFFFGIGAIKDIKVDILPKMNLPVIYIAHPFGGYTPDQMEAYFAKNYVNVLPFSNGIKSVETKNIQGLMIMKLTYYEGTNMAQAAAELSALSNRIQAAFPPGTQPPFIIRFDASSLPIGQLVLSSKIRSNNELQDLANVYVRASFTAIPGLLSPAPFGGSPRTIEVNVDPDLLRSHNMTPDQIVEAIRLNNQTAPSGNVRMGDKNYITPTNNTIKEVKDFEQIPLFKGGVQNLKLGDVASVKDGADITAGYALVNGKRSVYISIAKAGDASTWDVVQKLKSELPKIQSTLPEDVNITYEFDQSVYVINSVKSLITEGIIGAVLTGLMVLLFLGDRRAALIVIMTIPISIISGVLFLKLFGQTINLMSLSGLALAIGGLATAVRFDRDRSFYPVMLIVIAAIYVLFATLTPGQQGLGAEPEVAGPVLCDGQYAELGQALLQAPVVAHVVMERLGGIQGVRARAKRRHPAQQGQAPGRQSAPPPGRAAAVLVQVLGQNASPVSRFTKNGIGAVLQA